jgi:5-oxoprolinase (ATP-hydrolysing)/N-methylhydantoinase A
VIEHNGAQVGLITTEGYRDILHIARHKKPAQLLELPGPAVAAVPDRPPPLPARPCPERITRDGAVLVPLDEERRASRCGRLKEAGRSSRSPSASVSRSSIPEHEARVAEIVREEFPDAFLSVSSEVLPQYREYERFSTVCLNAYIGPRVSRYVAGSRRSWRRWT